MIVKKIKFDQKYQTMSEFLHLKPENFVFRALNTN